MKYGKLGSTGFSVFADDRFLGVSSHSYFSQFDAKAGSYLLSLLHPDITGVY